jgi:hypothetical protein
MLLTHVTGLHVLLMHTFKCWTMAAYGVDAEV